MRVLLCIDKLYSSIGILAQNIVKFCPDETITFDILEAHPKHTRDHATFLKKFEEMQAHYDLVHLHYWKVAEFLRPHVRIPSIVTLHYNKGGEMQMFQWDDRYDLVTTVNPDQHPKARRCICVPHGVDLSRFTLQEPYHPTGPVGMVCIRIVRLKHVLDVAQACQKIGKTLLLAGKTYGHYEAYLDEILKLPNVDFRGELSNGDLPKLYGEMSCLAINSDRETGPLPLLEAMACGIPVISREVGIVRQLFATDVEKVADDRIGVDQLQWFLDNRKRLERLHRHGPEVAARYSAQRMASSWAQVYHFLLKEKEQHGEVRDRVRTEAHR